jgi:hypothetical protein
MSLSKIIKIKRIVEISQSIISKINTITDKKDIHLNRKFMNKVYEKRILAIHIK